MKKKIDYDLKYKVIKELEKDNNYEKALDEIIEYKKYYYKREFKTLKGTVLQKNRMYRIRYIGRMLYEVYGLNYDVKICTISYKLLNYCFEEVKSDVK